MNSWRYSDHDECWYNLDRFKSVRLRNPQLDKEVEIIEGVYDNDDVIILYSDNNLDDALIWMNDFMNQKSENEC